MVLKRIDKDLSSDYEFDTAGPITVSTSLDQSSIREGPLNRSGQGELGPRVVISANADVGHRTSSLPVQTGASGQGRPGQVEASEF